MKQVKKRETFYLAGYDPRGARHYYNSYKKEAQLQQEVNRLAIDVSGRKRTSAYTQTWKLSTPSTHTKYHFLEWDDIIRKRWKNSTLSIFLDLFFYMRIYMFTGLIVKFGRLSPKQLAPAFYPILYLFLSLFLAFIIAQFGFDVAQHYLPFPIGLALALLLGYSVIRMMILIGDKIAVFWLLRIYVFCAKYVLTQMPELDTRTDNFATKIAQSIQNAKENEVDEILIVAHSVGAMLIIPVLAKVLSEGNISEESLKRVSIMTLGECTALVSFLEEAKTYKQQMQTIASQKNLFWVDYTAPIDGACFPLLDYYTHSGVILKHGEGPLFLSPRFHTLYTKEHYAALRKNRYLTHFVYLHATDYAGAYDFFKMTAGHQRLCSYTAEHQQDSNILN